MVFDGRTVFAAVFVPVLAACTTDRQYNRAIADLDAQWKIENDKIFDEIGVRYRESHPIGGNVKSKDKGEASAQKEI